MKNLLVFAAIILLSIGCQRQAKDILRPEVEAQKIYKFFNEKEKKTAPKYEAGVVTFKLRNNSSLSRVAGKSKPEHVFTKAMEKANDRGYFKVRVQDETKALSELKNNPDVQWASLNYAEVTQGIPDDPYWIDGSQWNLLHINMPPVWASGNFGNKTVYVAVIDEGIFSHDDLCGNIWRNPFELDNGIDDDGNGYIDDFNGWNWFDNNNQIYMGHDAHGTWCAGSIGAISGNKIGVASINPNVTIISCKFLQGYGFDDNAVKAIDYLIDLKQRHGLNIKVTSNSWGGGGYNPALVEAIDRAKNADILFVAAAGNADNDNDINPGLSYPAAYSPLCPNIIAVGASDWQNNKASFSSYGKTTVHLFAPGTGIVGTVPSSQHTSAYAFYSGTSMATPQVSGACALYAGIHGEANWQEIKNAILAHAQPLPQLTQYCVTGGLLDVSFITGQTPETQPPFYDCPVITPDQNPPSVPAMFEIYEVGFDGSLPPTDPFYGGYVAMRWTKAIDPEGQPVYYILTKDDLDYYAVYSSLDVVAIVFAGIKDTTKPQVWKVRAVDTWGNQSNYSNADTAIWNQTPLPPDTQAPSIPTNVNVTNPTLTSLKVNWTASTDNVAVVAYDVYRNGIKFQSTTNTFVIDEPLNSGTTYNYFVKARDKAGNISGQSNTASGTTLPVTPPPTCTPSTLLGVNQFGATVNLNWTISGNCTIQSTALERKKGKIDSPDQYTPIANNPISPYQTTAPGSGFWTYRIAVLSSGQTTYSNTITIKVNKK